MCTDWKKKEGSFFFFPVLGSRKTHCHPACIKILPALFLWNSLCLLRNMLNIIYICFGGAGLWTQLVRQALYKFSHASGPRIIFDRIFFLIDLLKKMYLIELNKQITDFFGIYSLWCIQIKSFWILLVDWVVFSSFLCYCYLGKNVVTFYFSFQVRFDKQLMIDLIPFMT